jgi:hypothetical protein
MPHVALQCSALYLERGEEKRSKGAASYRRSLVSFELPPSFLELSLSHYFRAELQIVGLQQNKNTIENVRADEQHHAEEQHGEERSEGAFQLAHCLQLIEVAKAGRHRQAAIYRCRNDYCVIARLGCVCGWECGIV